MTVFILLAVFVSLATIAFIIWGFPYFLNTSLPAPTKTGFGSETVSARIEQIVDAGTVNLGGVQQPYQDLSVQILEGQYKGSQVLVDYGKDQIQPEGITFHPGDRILVTVGLGPDGQLVANYADAVRTGPILLLLAVFVAALLVVARWKGLRSLLALAFSFLVVIGYIIPHIIHGEDPVRVSIIGSMILLIVTLYLTYGWNIKTHSAVLAILIVLIITGGLAGLFVKVALLTGNGNEEALYLMQMPGITINLRGLLLGGMILGTLGVLDDLIITQASAVFELREANSALGLRQLYQKAYRIGQDHVASTVNTLVMAYTGVALPMLLLFSLERGNYAQLVNVASVAEEIVRTLVGSVGLIAAVPVATFVAALMALYSDRLGVLRPYLGPETGEEAHSSTGVS
ncbi:MAG TPA: YibE/F family protein [Anaerolineales bacterium]|nr:YibE/F family protein [Anaerolineales bacterium]